MRPLVYFLLIAGLILSAACLFDTVVYADEPDFPNEATTTLTVKDENGEVIPYARASISYDSLTPSRDNADYNRGRTDIDGEFSFSGTVFYKVGARAHADGYYVHRLHYEPFEFGGRRENDFPDTEWEITLKKMIRPVEMVLRDKLHSASIPAKDEELGYDILAGDWVAPHGQGKMADIVVKLTGELYDTRQSEAYYDLVFPNPHDGLIEHEYDPRNKSDLLGPQAAPLSGYDPGPWKWFERRMKPDSTGRLEFILEQNNTDDVFFLIRFRTVVDGHGNVLRAYYGRIVGEPRLSGKWQTAAWQGAFRFNPVPNDRSLEDEELVRRTRIEVQRWDEWIAENEKGAAVRFLERLIP